MGSCKLQFDVLVICEGKLAQLSFLTKAGMVIMLLIGSGVWTKSNFG